MKIKYDLFITDNWLRITFLTLLNKLFKHFITYDDRKSLQLISLIWNCQFLIKKMTIWNIKIFCQDNANFYIFKFSQILIEKSFGALHIGNRRVCTTWHDNASIWWRYLIYTFNPELLIKILNLLGNRQIFG